MKRSLSAQAIRTSSLIGLIKTGRALNSPSTSQPQPPPRVRIVPSADGVVVVIGVTVTGEWVAEHRCRTEDFDDRTVRAMERKVREKEDAALRLVR